MLILLTVPKEELGEKIGKRLSAGLDIPYLGFLTDKNPAKDCCGVLVQKLDTCSQIMPADITILLHQDADLSKIEEADFNISRYDLVLNKDCLGTTGTVEVLKQFYITKMMQQRSAKRMVNPL